ncbi:activator of HSP90 ATPase [Kaistella flava (ex Peng et al. 2021)]|uniref:Activator of HSP90 ATPase n=1 Tax=Kaistella flava (ex Peng et al. 2021) TaxID=2038776 RepID=A0A7M2Y7J7_9FLAO|nr:SRPBCC domain-containing protein [Kaistella flava (ex Peng et al. 2021)]QOW10238.1 activator of HSP90 ATPase [Kaistella flava (ex Peng et al. 2021)]
MEPIKIDITILKPISKVWEFFTEPEHITRWNFANDIWMCPNAENDLQIGGEFNYRMEAKDQSFGFDFKGTYDEVFPFEKLKYHLEDGRKVEVLFESIDANTTKVFEIFEPEELESRQMQRDGWYGILDNFQKYAENN